MDKAAYKYLGNQLGNHSYYWFPINTYLLDSDLSGGWHYPAFEQLRPDVNLHILEGPHEKYWVTHNTLVN